MLQVNVLNHFFSQLQFSNKSLTIKAGNEQKETRNKEQTLYKEEKIEYIGPRGKRVDKKEFGQKFRSLFWGFR